MSTNPSSGCRPGVSGLAQINLPPDSDFQSVRCKLVLDLEYIEHAGPLLDIRMFLCTATRLLGLSGERAMRLMRLSRDVSLPQPSSSSDQREAVLSTAVPAEVVAVAAREGAGGNGTVSPNGRVRNRRTPRAEAPQKPR